MTQIGMKPAIRHCQTLAGWYRFNFFKRLERRRETVDNHRAHQEAKYLTMTPDILIQGLP